MSILGGGVSGSRTHTQVAAAPSWSRDAGSTRVAPGYSGGRGEELTHHERNGRLEIDAGRTFDSLPRTSSKSAKGSSLIGDLDRLRATSGIA